MASASYSITLRVITDSTDQLAIGRVTTAIGEAEGQVVAFDFVETDERGSVIDVTVNASNSDHALAISAAVEAVEGATVHKVSDRTFLMHLGGKIEVRSKVDLRNRDQLSMAYTPGVARVSMAIYENPEDARNLTVKGNMVAIVTDGTAVLGLGDIGPLAALPVMEGKAALFKRFANVDAFPICLDTKDTEEIIRTVQLIAPVFGGINLEDIAAPRCFEIEERLRELLDIPVFHDDQHGTAIVVVAALRNALKVVGKTFDEVVVSMSGAGAAGVAIAKMLLAEHVKDIIVSDSKGIIHKGRELVDNSKLWMADNTNKAGMTGGILESLDGADVFIGVSAPNLFDAKEIARMNDKAIIFALANPDPEVDPVEARKYAAVVATGRSDYPNQINNVLAFPGVFRGALDARASEISEAMKLAAAKAIAEVVTDSQLSPVYIIPSVFNGDVVIEVAKAVREAAHTD
ncbi:MAG: NAD-dependent malic enzyme [Acidimicrobiia bacterium]|nr:NAD-dependent malic enzyme [Acidimicrobiia bacterium]